MRDFSNEVALENGKAGGNLNEFDLNNIKRVAKKGASRDFVYKHEVVGSQISYLSIREKNSSVFGTIKRITAPSILSVICIL